MKTPFRDSILLVAVAGALALAIGFAQFTTAAPQKKEARVTQIIKDVRLLPGGASPRPASVNDFVTIGMAVRTGVDSRTELTFTDQTLTRLGANSIFSFAEGAKAFDLASGAMLLSVPGGGSAQVKVGAATAAVTGFTAMFEHHAKSWSKFIILYGKGKMNFPGLGDPCRLHEGQMIVWPPHPVRCPEVLNVDISKLLQGKLVRGFKRPLPELNLILAVAQSQQEAPPPPGGLIDPTNIDALDQAGAAHPSPPHEMPTQSPPGKKL